MFSNTELIARYSETDQMGIIHHSVYPKWFECGRTDFIKLFGYSYGELEKNGLMLPIISYNCKLMQSVRYEDKVLVKTSLIKNSPVRMTLAYEIYKNGESKPSAYGETEHVWTSNSLKPLNIKKYNIELYDKFENAIIS